MHSTMPCPKLQARIQRRMGGACRRAPLVLHAAWVLFGDVPVGASPSHVNATAKWFLVPEDDLASFEAFEYAILRINEMRTECSGFHLAPLVMHNYRAPEVYVQRHDLYSDYHLRIEPMHNLAPSPIEVWVSQEHSVTDLSLFQVTKVKPSPCDLYSAMDDAELMVPWKGPAAKKAQEAAMHVLNRERKILCPQRPELQLQRVVAASQQPVEGVVIRLLLEMREASESFRLESFMDIVEVSYTLDPDVPGQCTISPEIYPARPPCKMRFAEREQNEMGQAPGAKERRLRGGAGEASLEPGSPRSLRELRRQRSRQRGRRLSASVVDTAPSGSKVMRQFVDRGLDIPDDFDPRLRRTLCFPRGFSRQQGSCGSSFAFTATAVAAFRECLWKLDQGEEGSGLRFFSAQELTSCAGQGDGCAGGSAASAFYHMKWEGVPRESCSPYRMRCFNDNSGISQTAADAQTSQHRSAHFDSETSTCPVKPDPNTAPCKCLASVYHFTKPVDCALLPNACEKTRIPHYFFIAGTAEGSTVPLFERHVMQELLVAGPLYISLLFFDDFFDPVSWTESGIYIHKGGELIGKHAVAAVGWGTDADSRDYWLLLNSFGNGWQQEGYFKVLRGETALKLTKFGAWGTDWSHPDADKSKPTIADVQLSFSPVLHDIGQVDGEEPLAHVFLLVSAFTDEDARVLVRIQGLSNTVTGQVKDHDFAVDHVLKLDLLDIGLLDDRAKTQIWAVDRAQNTATWGPYTLEIPGKRTFRLSQARRLSATELDRPLEEAVGSLPPSWV